MRIEGLASGKLLLLVFAAWLIFGVALFQAGPYQGLSDAAGSTGLPEESVDAALPRIPTSLGNLEAEGRATYRGFQGLDGFNALFTTLVLILALRFAGRSLFPQGSPLLWLTWLPAGMFIAEAVENYSLFRLAGSYPEMPDATLALATTATLVKFGFVMVLVPLTILALVAAALVGWIRRQRNREKQGS